MSIFLSSPSHYRSGCEPNFGSLFRLLSDFDNFHNEVGSSTASGARFTPKFDCRETQDAFELHGELPGVDKENVSIEFTNSQTMEIRGKVERSYSSGTPPSDKEDKEEAPSHKATVEDSNEEGEESEMGTEAATPATTAATIAATTEKAVEKKDGARYWVRERSFGSFSRQFTFPHRVDPDNIQASYKDGILNVIIPKAKKAEPRRIAIQ